MLTLTLTYFMVYAMHSLDSVRISIFSLFWFAKYVLDMSTQRFWRKVCVFFDIDTYFCPSSIGIIHNLILCCCTSFGMKFRVILPLVNKTNTNKRRRKLFFKFLAFFVWILRFQFTAFVDLMSHFFRKTLSINKSTYLRRENK